ncbi:hypothetical protein [Curtobacterium sp. 20TX0008]|uniref:hypothetical protein n=1 Tax=Curtobacterium sp. 20TX0008 TaxID=3022018 RepID=UPI00232E7072|nr:hypothetical protein [Curtobacterium sp. 20TX0008]MDB6427898.1 hypothetical protein [Curtobacterium sp. 20TX0008]
MPRRKQPLKESAFRIGVTVVGMIVGLTVAFLVLPAVTGDDERGPLWAYVVGAALAVVVGVGALVLGLAVGRRLVGDRVEAALREPGGKWRHGRFDVAHGGTTFERYRWQLRIPSGRKLFLTGVGLGPDTGERPPLRQLWTINPQLHVIGLDSDQGRYEVAASPSRLELLRDQLDEQAGR